MPMKFLKNPEENRIFIASIILTAVLTVVGFFIGMIVGVLLLVLGSILTIMWTVATKKRYKEIEELSNTVDKILHSKEVVVLQDNKEGDLAVLQSEIHKMTIKIREQAFELEKDKIYLTDSIADISHQLRTPLTTINLILEFLQREDITERERRIRIQSIKQSLSRIDWLVSSLLKLSKIDAGTADFKMEKVYLSHLIDKAVKPLLISMELRNQVCQYESHGKEAFNGDINWTCEAIGNILKNCMEHTPVDGQIVIEGKENNLYTEIVISDNGPGISEKDMPHLFERFYRGENSGEHSVGIGLALARTIIQEQNGTIKVENIPEGGARFTIRFYKNERILK